MFASSVVLRCFLVGCLCTVLVNTYYHRRTHYDPIWRNPVQFGGGYGGTVMASAMYCSYCQMMNWKECMQRFCFSGFGYSGYGGYMGYYGFEPFGYGRYYPRGYGRYLYQSG